MRLWLHEKPLVLASGSSSRAALLKSAALPFIMAPVPVDERALEAKSAGLLAREMARMLARAKACAASPHHPGALVLGADQVLALGETRFHKPASREEAADQLRRLRGHTHRLESAAVIALDGKVVVDVVETALMTMRDFSDAFLEAYLERAGETVIDSVGAYKIEAEGIHLFERVEGDRATIMGLPLMSLLAALRERGVVCA